MKSQVYKLPAKYPGGDKNPWSGEIEFELLNTKERNALLLDLQIEIGEDGKAKEIEGNVKSQIEKINVFIDLCFNKIKKLDVKKGKAHYTSLEELDYDAEANSFFAFIGNHIFSAGGVGNG